MHYPQLRDGY